MNEQEIRHILEQGECETIEFKESFGKEAIQTAGALANTNGGYIFIGVDKKGNIKGTSISKESLKNWGNRITQLSEPTLIPSIHSIKINGKTVVIVSVKEFPLKPVSINGRCYKRVDASNKIMTPAEISEMHLQSTGTTWDAMPCPNTNLDDIEIQKVKDYILRTKDTGRRHFKEDEDVYNILHKLDLVKENKPSWAAIIAFGEKPPMQAKVKCGKIRGTSTIVDDFVVDAPLLDQVEEVMNYMKRVLKLSYSISGKAKRDEIWEYPLDAVREVVTNAICHRDYSSPAEIQIKIFDDRLTVFNPGALPFGMSVEKLMDPNHNSIPRNRLIAMLFYDTELIERYGSGIQRILDDCHKHEFPAPEFNELEFGFQVIFHKDIYTEEHLAMKGLNGRQIKAILYIKERGKITNEEYRNITGLSDEGARIDLTDLISKGFVKSMGGGRSTHYILNKSGD